MRRSDIEWNTGEGIEVGDSVQFTHQWYADRHLIPVANRKPFEVLRIYMPRGLNPETTVEMGFYPGPTKLFKVFTVLLRDIELVSKGHKPLKDRGPLV